MVPGHFDLHLHFLFPSTSTTDLSLLAPYSISNDIFVFIRFSTPVCGLHGHLTTVCLAAAPWGSVRGSDRGR